MNEIARQRQEQMILRKIAALERKLDYIETEIKDYQDDFEILTNSEEEIAQLNAMASNNEHLCKAFNNSLEEITKLGTADDVPGFQKLFSNFENKISAGNSKISTKNDSYAKQIEIVAKDIDSAQKEVGEGIKEKKREKESVEAEIKRLKASLP